MDILYKGNVRSVTAYADRLEGIQIKYDWIIAYEHITTVIFGYIFVAYLCVNMLFSNVL